MTDVPERCAVCHEPANDQEGGLVSVVGTVPSSQSPEPIIQRVHEPCRQYVLEDDRISFDQPADSRLRGPFDRGRRER
jgi:hypothetical protein